MNINLTLFAQAVVFAAFIWFTVKFVWPPLLRAIEARQKTDRRRPRRRRAGPAVARDFAQAGRAGGHGSARARRRRSSRRPRSARAQLVEEAKNAAKAEGEREKAAAKAEIEQEVSRAREQLREQVAALAVAGAEKILRREVDAKAHADLLDASKRSSSRHMAEPSTIARPYAEAVFKLARRAAATLAEWSAALADLAGVAADERMRAAIGDPNLSPAQGGGALHRRAGGQARPATRRTSCACSRRTAAWRCCPRSARSSRR